MRVKKAGFSGTMTKEKWQLWAERAIILVAFVIYFSLSCYLPVEKAPDEYMRYDVTEYIFCTIDCLPGMQRKSVIPYGDFLTHLRLIYPLCWQQGLWGLLPFLAEKVPCW